MSTIEQTKEELMEEQILQAAKQLFQAHGFRKVTMDDVAKAIGKGRSSLYYYYKSKEEVLEAVMDVEIRDLLNAIAKGVERATTTEEKIHAFCATKLNVIRDRRSFFSTINTGMDADEMSNYNKAAQGIHRRIMKQEGVLLHQILNQGIEKGEVRAMDEKEQESFIYVLLSTVHGLKREMAIESDYSGIEPAVNAFTQMVMHGLKK